MGAESERVAQDRASQENLQQKDEGVGWVGSIAGQHQHQPHATAQRKQCSTRSKVRRTRLSYGDERNTVHEVAKSEVG